MSEQTTEAITAEGLEALKAELEQLEGEERRKIAARIQTARELGDLSENAEYHAAKEDQGHLETKILRLQERLRGARVVEAPEDASVVLFGGTVVVADEESGRESTYTIVGPTEADLKQGKLSAESPVAKALMGAAAGDVVDVPTPRGVRKLRVVRLGG
ncbi:transcription elongation factor GreA [Conexibacter sp. SYSU D00693]|uniref:transcription elongation factor GreA n=1 Tax=Conexibacter sp. SYSU D00693 TaxID=2812560 RepID=UPI00196A2268|nr:transcription elongation factor GreA [Conexibacter sp. SYSU D00693]